MVDRVMAARAQIHATRGAKGGQVILDLRGQTGMTSDIASRGVVRAFGRDSKLASENAGIPLISAIRVIADNADFQKLGTGFWRDRQKLGTTSRR